MILSKQDCEQFFAIYDALTDYVNGKWGVAPAVIDPRSGYVNEENQRKVAAELWRNTNIINEFVADNSYALSSEELQIARSWTSAFTDSFYALQPAPRTMYFANPDAAFEVTGLSREVVSMLGSLPACVNATLLPFKEYIVCAVYLEEIPVLIGSDLQRAVDDSWQALQQEGAVLKTGAQLVERAAYLEEKRISREAERMISSLEAEMSPDEPAEGSHRGVLAGLSDEERKRAVDEYAHTYPDGQTAIKKLRRFCTAGEPERDLSVLLQQFTRNELLSIARDMQIPRVSNKNKAQIADAIISSSFAPESLNALLSAMDPEDFDKVRELYRQGGYVSVPASEMRKPEQFFPYVPMLSYAFLHDATFEFVMPTQTYEAARHVNWDEVAAEQEELKLAISTANLLVELRGAVPMTDVYEQYLPRTSNPRDIGDIALSLAYGPRDDLALYDFWFGSSPEQCYLVHSDIAAALDAGNKKVHGRSRLHVGELPVEIDDLFAVQQGKQPRTISEEMATVGEYVPWARTKPAAVALRDYLDAHVPDGADDYTFADGVVDDLIVMCTGEYPMQNITDYLSSELVLSGVDQLRRIMELFTNLSNSLPKWSNNGWSPNEISEGMGSGKVFYNADGSVKRVGPYDACPCGSGKKYKDCHGK